VDLRSPVRFGACCHLYLVQISRSDCARIDRASSGSLSAEFLRSFSAFSRLFTPKGPVSGSGVLTHCGPSSGVLSPGFLAAFSAPSLGMSFPAFDHCVLRCHRVTLGAPFHLWCRNSLGGIAEPQMRRIAACVSDALLGREMMLKICTPRDCRSAKLIEKSMGLQFFIVPEHTAIPVRVFRAGELPAAGFRTKTQRGWKLSGEDRHPRRIQVIAKCLGKIYTIRGGRGVTFRCHLELVSGALLCISVHFSTEGNSEAKSAYWKKLSNYVVLFV